MFNQKRFFILIISLTISACSSVSKEKAPVLSLPQTERHSEDPLPSSVKPKYNLSGYPANTQQGYIDGCETAKNSSFAFKDLNRYEEDDQYRIGWDDGHALCKVKKE